MKSDGDDDVSGPISILIPSMDHFDFFFMWVPLTLSAFWEWTTNLPHFHPQFSFERHFVSYFSSTFRTYFLILHFVHCLSRTQKAMEWIGISFFFSMEKLLLNWLFIFYFYGEGTKDLKKKKRDKDNWTDHTAYFSVFYQTNLGQNVICFWCGCSCVQGQMG